MQVLKSPWRWDQSFTESSAVVLAVRTLGRIGIVILSSLQSSPVNYTNKKLPCRLKWSVVSSDSGAFTFCESKSEVSNLSTTSIFSELNSRFLLWFAWGSDVIALGTLALLDLLQFVGGKSPFYFYFLVAFWVSVIHFLRWGWCSKLRRCSMCIRLLHRTLLRVSDLRLRYFNWTQFSKFQYHLEPAH